MNGKSAPNLMARILTNFELKSSRNRLALQKNYQIGAFYRLGLFID